MPEIPSEVIKHKLSIDLAFKPIKQNESRYTPERRKTIRLEVNKLLEAGFIRSVDYPSWLANPVLVEKPDKSWRMCIDHTSLNKACPKDEYPLPHICQIVDSTASCELLSFMNAYSGYHQINLAIDDEEKQRSLRHLGFFVTPRWRSGSRTEEIHIKNVCTQSWKVRSSGTSKLILMI
jgi:hypothetical protein